MCEEDNVFRIYLRLCVLWGINYKQCALRNSCIQSLHRRHGLNDGNHPTWRVSWPTTFTPLPSVSHGRETIYDLACSCHTTEKILVRDTSVHSYADVRSLYAPPTPLPFHVSLYPLLTLLLSLSSRLLPVFSNLHLMIVACASVTRGLFTGTWAAY